MYGFFVVASHFVIVIVAVVAVAVAVVVAVVADVAFVVCLFLSFRSFLSHNNPTALRQSKQALESVFTKFINLNFKKLLNVMQMER